MRNDDLEPSLQTTARFQYEWKEEGITINDSQNTCWRSLSFVLRSTSDSTGFSWPKNVEDSRLSIEIASNERHQIKSEDFGSPAAFRFVLDSLIAADHENGTVVALIVPQSRAYIVRSDIIPLRLVDCPVVKIVRSFSEPHQLFEGGPVSLDDKAFPAVFAAAAGGLVLKQSHGITIESLLRSLNVELSNRLSFPWMSTQVPKRKTLAVVEGGRYGPDNGGTGESIYAAAHALGIDMVVLDDAGHWLTDPRYAHWTKAFIPIDLPDQPDEKFPGQVIEALRAYHGPIDGIMTFYDCFKSSIAEVATRLSLPTASPEAYATATNKYKTSVFEGRNSYQASSVEEASKAVQEGDLEFPLIIKPCNGYLSEGVFRAENLPQMLADIQVINTERHGMDFVIEKYCDGPEVDANFLLCDGEVIFFEASDDFPKSADANGDGKFKSFIELANVLPSKLPEQEIATIRDSLHQSLLRMNLRDGFFHLEARMDNSAMEYATQNNVLDLFERETPAKRAPAVWLIEINPRPPAIQVSQAVEHTYGIDYFGLSLVFAIDDKQRARQLSHPFAQGAQYWCEIIFIPVEKGGVYQSGDVCAELFERRPDLAQSVSKCFCFLKKGVKVADPYEEGIGSWVAYFNVFSRESRLHVLEIAEEVKREVRFSIV